MRFPLQWEDQKNFFQKKIKNDWYPFMKKQTWRELLLLIRMEMHTTTME